jgi:NAD(P)-dependent dehydrogenase (short-subunit alcohol dehydrogenase family)
MTSITGKETRMNRLEDRVAAVTGAADGIGFAIAERLAAEGARVAVLDINDPQPAADKLDGLGVQVDVSDAEQVRGALQTVVDHYGRLDILVNNAGIDGESTPVADYPVEVYRRVIAVNLDGVFHGLRYGIPHLLANGGGAIINIASGAAVKAIPGLSPYCASKAGVVALTRTIAVEYAPHGIRINVVLPGAIETPLLAHVMANSLDVIGVMAAQHPLGRIGAPPEIAAAVAFLASDDASFITGVALPVDGGFAAT